MKSKTKLAFKVLAYLLCAALMIFYLVIFFSKPNVSIEYRLYYIDDVLMDWVGDGGLDYKLGTPINFGTENNDLNARRKGRGWDTSSANYVSVIKNDAPLFFTFDASNDLICTIKFGETNINSYNIKANATTVLNAAKQKNGSVSFEIDKSLISEDRLLTLSFEMDTTDISEQPYLQIISIVINEKEGE